MSVLDCECKRADKGYHTRDDFSNNPEGQEIDKKTSTLDTGAEKKGVGSRQNGRDSQLVVNA